MSLSGELKKLHTGESCCQMQQVSIELSEWAQRQEVFIRHLQDKIAHYKKCGPMRVTVEGTAITKVAIEPIQYSPSVFVDKEMRIRIINDYRN